MKKNTGLALAGAVLALAYPAAAWVTGLQVESAIAQNYELISENPSLKIVGRDYRRGIFGASETVTLELFGNVTQALAQQRQQALAENPDLPMPPVQAIRVMIRSEIKHGPLPGFKTFAAATADSELVLDAAMAAQLATVFGDQKPLQSHTVYRFDGGGSATLSSPGFSTYWQSAESAGKSTLAWDGLTMRVDFEKGMRSYTLHAEAPRFELKEPRGGQMTLLGLQLDAAQQRIFEDDPLLYGGTQKLTLARAAFGGQEGSEPIELRRAHYTAEVPVKGDFIDLIGRFGSESLRIAGKDYGPANYDISIRHVHARTAAKLYRELIRIYSDSELQAAAATAPAKALAPLAGPAGELLAHNPELSIDRLSFRSPHGDAALALRMKFNDLQAKDLANPLLLIGKLDASADLSLPEGLLNDMAGSLPTPAAMPESAEAAEVAAAAASARSEQLRQQVDGFAAQGFVVREGGLLKTKIAFSNGRMTVNGQPFNPMAGAMPPMAQ